jgi:hypothetical protein
VRWRWRWRWHDDVDDGRRRHHGIDRVRIHRIDPQHDDDRPQRHVSLDQIL